MVVVGEEGGGGEWLENTTPPPPPQRTLSLLVSTDFSAGTFLMQVSYAVGTAAKMRPPTRSGIPTMSPRLTSSPHGTHASFELE